MNDKPKYPLVRPETTVGKCHQVETGCGHLYVTIGRIPETGEPVELFLTLGHSGSCERCHNEAVGRLAGLAMRYGAPLDKIAEALKGIQCPKKVWDRGISIESCPDAAASAVEAEAGKPRKAREIHEP